MKLDTLLFYIKIIAIVVALVMFVFKFIDGWRYKSKTNRPMKFKLLSWYTSIEVVGSSSASRREIMQRSNITTTIFWICIAIAVATSFVPIP